MGVLAPYFLMGMMALAIPIIVHLWSKNTRKSVDFGSIRFLRETETKTMKSIMPSQWLLLFLRLLLLALLVFLMAEPFMERKMESVDTMYLVDPKHADSPWFQSWKDSLKEDDRAFWLSNDFPSLEQEVSPENGDYWDLLSNPPKLNTQKTVVISPLLMTDFNGMKRSFPVDYEWMRLPVDPILESALTYQKGNEAFQVNTTFDEWQTTHALQSISNAEPIRIIYYLETSEEYGAYENLFKTALNTLNELSALTLEQTSDLEEADWVFWLSSERTPIRSQILMIDSLSVNKWREVGSSRIQISNDWEIQDALALNLPRKLLQLMSPSLSTDMDQRTMDVNSFTYQKRNVEENFNRQESATSIFWVLLLVGLIVERWASFKSDKK